MSDPQNAQKGSMHIDATNIVTVKFTPEHLNTLTKVHAGLEDAVANVARLELPQLTAAGISLDEAKDIIEIAADHKYIGTVYEASAYMTEALRHTHLDRGHKLSTRIAEAVEQAKRRAERSTNGAEILGPLGDLLEYQLGPAMKAVVTKAKAKASASKVAEKATEKASEKVAVAPKANGETPKADGDATP